MDHFYGLEIVVTVGHIDKSMLSKSFIHSKKLLVKSLKYIKIKL